MNFKSTIELVQFGQHLNKQEAYEVMLALTNGNFNESQKAALVIALSNRDLSVNELSGYRTALLDLCQPISLDASEAIDLCGTGGDQKNTFNISTLAAFLVAGAGFRVVKHGNYGVSSISGSSNVLEYLGYRFTNSEDQLNRELDDTNICFLHAPLFHPALKQVAHTRRELGIKTFFNALGPLVNPAKPKHQLVGVYSLKLARIYHYLLQDTDRNYAVVHSLDGYDEISLTSDAQLYASTGESIIKAEDFGFNRIDPVSIYGGTTMEKSCAIFVDILSGKGTEAQNQVVIANAAAAIQCFDPSRDLQTCVQLASESLQSGRALNTLNSLLKHQKYAG